MNKSTTRTALISTALIATFSLAACGGGGGSTPAPPASTYAATSLSTLQPFAATVVGGSSAGQSVTLTSTGTAPLSLSSITTDSAAFKITGGTCAAGGSLNPGGTCTVNLVFLPTVAGTTNGSLTFADNSTLPASPQVISLSGTGTALATVNSDLVTSVTPPTYASGTIEKGGWDVLMTQRSTCGFGLLQQDTRLDVASAAHTHYLVQNSLDRKLNVGGHFEDPTWTYFYANAPWDRATKAGFPSGVLEILDEQTSTQSSSSLGPLIASEALGANSMRTLIETVYHARGAFWGGRSGGIGSTLATGPFQTGFNMTAYRLVAEISNEADSLKQKLGTGNLATWPCAGLSGVGGKFTPAIESPNPFPEITSTAVTYGTPIYFKADPGSVLVVSSATVTKTSDGSTLVLRQLNKSNDPAAEILGNEVFLVPTTALAAGSSYAVDATGTLNGKSFVQNFTFSTAP